MAFPKKERQKIVDGYLVETGRNMFHPAEFVAWLRERPDHVAYPWFFGKSDSELAEEARIDIARRMVSGLRIVARASAVPSESTVVNVAVEYPAFVSPLHGRRSGGGYHAVDPSDPEHIAELRRQGLVALKAWLGRYGSAFGGEAESVVAMIERLDEKVVEPA